MQLHKRPTGRLAIAAVSCCFLSIVGISVASAQNATPFVRFASPSAALNQPSAQPVALTSCCEATMPCDGSSCAASGACCDAGCCVSDPCDRWGGLFGASLRDHLSGLIKPSDHCFDCFISPMTNPVFFEDPRTLTEARFIYFHHKVPLTAGGGEVDLFAVQLRAALTDRLSVIATKDGFLTSDNPLIDDGWADINIGLKYNLIRCPECQFLYSIGATYELPVGSTRALQGNGDGTYHLFSTGGTQYWGNNFILAHGWIIPGDSDAESEWCYFSGHASRKLGASNFYALAEMNWYHWLESGSNTVVPGVEGLDIINLGSVNVTGNDIVTGAFGVKYKPSGHLELGVAWENPLTERRDIIDNRLTFDCILRY